MKNIKKALVFVVSLLVIFAFANLSFASSITVKNSTNDNETSASQNETDNSTDNVVSNNSTSNKIVNNSSSSLNSVNQSSNSTKAISSSNSSENLPSAGIDGTYFNMAMILLLALVLCMFSLVQYNKISKKDN